MLIHLAETVDITHNSLERTETIPLSGTSARNSGVQESIDTPLRDELLGKDRVGELMPHFEKNVLTLGLIFEISNELVGSHVGYKTDKVLVLGRGGGIERLREGPRVVIDVVLRDVALEGEFVAGRSGGRLETEHVDKFVDLGCGDLGGLGDGEGHGCVLDPLDSDVVVLEG